MTFDEEIKNGLAPYSGVKVLGTLFLISIIYPVIDD
jgi:hypothetical protein